MTSDDERVRTLMEGMKGALNAHAAGRGPLDRLVWELKSRISALEGQVDQDWLEELRSAWWRLEYVNAIVIDQGRTELTDEERKEIEEAGRELHGLLASEVSRRRPES